VGAAVEPHSNQIVEAVGSVEHGRCGRGHASDLRVFGEGGQGGLRKSKHLDPVVEANDAMRGSYVMVGPLGRFIGNSSGAHVYSRPILEVGVQAALSEVDWSPRKFAERGGTYDWAPTQSAPPARTGGAR
jgi:hypothetical protein